MLILYLFLLFSSYLLSLLCYLLYCFHQLIIASFGFFFFCFSYLRFNLIDTKFTLFTQGEINRILCNFFKLILLKHYASLNFTKVLQIKLLVPIRLICSTQEGIIVKSNQSLQIDKRENKQNNF